MANPETTPADERADAKIDEKDDDDRRADAWAVLVIFASLVLGAVHFMSGWTFDLHL